MYDQKNVWVILSKRAFICFFFFLGIVNIHAATNVIKKGEIIEVLYEQKNIYIKIVAKALSPAAIGDTIMLETIPSYRDIKPKIITALVVSPKKAKIVL